MRRTSIFLGILLAIAIVLSALPGHAVDGVTILSNTTESPAPQSAASLTTAGGSFTTLLLNATSQTMKWKAYVGNVTGQLQLQDASDFTIYDWALTSIPGEVYASRNNSISWSQIQCAQNSTIGSEEVQLNINTLDVDSINRTFSNTTHQAFYVETTLISASSCRAIATYKNNARQSPSATADFQEILLDDTSHLVYATILENDVIGYNNGRFDFQMIVPEDPTSTTPHTYYFWAELV